MNSSIAAEGTAQQDQGSLSSSNSTSSGDAGTPDAALASAASSSNMQPLNSSTGASYDVPADLAWPAEQLQQQRMFQPVAEQQQQQQQRLQDMHAAAADSTEAEADNSAAAEEAVAAGPRELDKFLFVDGMRVSALKAASTGLYAQAPGEQPVHELGG
jgi:hypothetical protein